MVRLIDCCWPLFLFTGAGTGTTRNSSRSCRDADCIAALTKLQSLITVAARQWFAALGWGITTVSCPCKILCRLSGVKNVLPLAPVLRRRNDSHVTSWEQSSPCKVSTVTPFCLAANPLQTRDKNTFTLHFLTCFSVHTLLSNIWRFSSVFHCSLMEWGRKKLNVCGCTWVSDDGFQKYAVSLLEAEIFLADFWR